MANHSAAVAVHATNAGSTVDVVTLAENYGTVEVLNRGTATLWVLVDNAAHTNPTVGGDDCYVVPAGAARSIGVPEGVTVLRVLADASCAYSVTGE
jgi:hypothetical protein